MNVYKFIKSLTQDERIILAGQCNTTKTYLNFLASKCDHLSIKLAGKIYDSAMNQKRDKTIQFTEKDWKSFHKKKAIARGKFTNINRARPNE